MTIHIDSTGRRAAAPADLDPEGRSMTIIETETTPTMPIPVDSAFMTLAEVYRTLGRTLDNLRRIMATDATELPDQVVFEVRLLAALHDGLDAAVGKVLADLSPDLLGNLEISQLRIDVRTWGTLRHGRIGTVAELVTRTEADLLAIRGFDPAWLDEVKRALAGFGLALAGTPGESA